MTDLRREIAARQPGDRLPSVRELVARHRASPVTVQRAIARLTAEGIVEPRPGRGTFVAAAAATGPEAPDLSWQAVALGASHGVDPGGLDELMRLPRPGDVALSSGFPERALQPTGVLGAALARAGRHPGAWHRPPVEGLEALRAHVARETGEGFGPQDVVIHPGGQAGLFTALRALAEPRDPVLVESPTYFGALAAARALGLRPVPVPTDAEGVRPDLLERALAATGARVMLLQPTFANPTGVSLSPPRREAVLALAEARGVFIVEDDWARDLAIDGEPPPPLVRGDRNGHVVYVRSYTKSAAPGLRVAAVCARGAAGARILAARVVTDFFVSGPLQEATLDLVNSAAWRRHRRDVAAALRERRDVLADAVARRLPWAQVTSLPRGGFHLWLALEPGMDDVAFAADAAVAGVVVSPGRPWFPAEPPGPHLRLTFAAGPPYVLLEGVERLALVGEGARG